MRLLLDTHAFLWWLEGNERLPVGVREQISDQANDVVISAVSAWEITTKFRLGKLPSAAFFAEDIASQIDNQGFEALSITMHHAEKAGRLAGPHRDPFDRMLIAQSLLEDMPIVSNELPFDAYGVRRIW